MPSLFKRGSKSSSPTRSAGKSKGALNPPMLIGALAIVGVFVGVFTVASSMSESYTYYRATVDIPAGSKLQSSMFTADTRPGSQPPGDNMIYGSDAITPFLDKIATSNISMGDALEKSDFYIPRDPNATPDPANPQAEQEYAYRFSELLGEGLRGVAILADPTSNYIRAGDYVDVYYVSADSAKRLFTKKVIYIIPQEDPAIPADGTSGDGSVTGQPVSTTLMLDLNAQEAQDLFLIQKTAEIRIAIVSPEAAANPGSQTLQTTPDYLIKTYGVTIPGFAPPDDEVIAPTAAPTLPPLATPDPNATAAPSEGIPGLPSASPAP